MRRETDNVPIGTTAMSTRSDERGRLPDQAHQKPVKTSEKAEDLLEFGLENERITIANYHRRVKQADELNEFATAESLRGILESTNKIT